MAALEKNQVSSSVVAWGHGSRPCQQEFNVTWMTVHVQEATDVPSTGRGGSPLMAQSSPRSLSLKSILWPAHAACPNPIMPVRLFLDLFNFKTVWAPTSVWTSLRPLRRRLHVTGRGSNWRDVLNGYWNSCNGLTLDTIVSLAVP